MHLLSNHFPSFAADRFQNKGFHPETGSSMLLFNHNITSPNFL